MSTGNNNNQLRVGIIGVGPVGTTLAAHLKDAGATVVPCDVFTHKIDAIKKKGIRLTHTIEKHVPIEHACYTVQELGMYDLDLIIVAVKTPDLQKVVKQIQEIDSARLHVMCAQNGIDNEVEVGQAFGDHRTLRMVVNFAGNMTDSSTVHVSFFNPPNYVAALADGGNAMAHRLADLFNSVKLDTEVPEDIQDYVWGKAILNAALSAICAISHRTMKEVMDFPRTLELVEAIIDESVRVAEMERIELGHKFRRFCIRYLKNAGHHRPSMLVDLENGDPTEIDQLNGKIVQYGRKHCLPTPLNQSVTALIHLLEHNSK
ncbi:MAG TPA: ketopantoate reductase family protein [Candidatus Deferrimicrobium sp.]|nr:ketopantoate reductase family protein [Candidatus Deferrimicrobium sp.]